MGVRKVIVKQSAAEGIAAIAWFIESKGMIATADKFTDDAYDHFINLADKRKSYPLCKEPGRHLWVINVSPIKRNTLMCLLKRIKS